MTGHLGFPLLSFGRERPERVSTFPSTTPELNENCTFQPLHLPSCSLVIGQNSISSGFILPCPPPFFAFPQSDRSRSPVRTSLLPIMTSPVDATVTVCPTPPSLDEDDAMNDESPPEHQIDPDAPDMNCDCGTLAASRHAPAPDLPPAANLLFTPAQEPLLPAPDIDPPSFGEFIRSSDPLEDNILGLTQPEHRTPTAALNPVPEPYFGPTIGTAHPTEPRPATALQTMAHTINQIYALNYHQKSQIEELRAEIKVLRTITGGLRGDINRTEKKVEKTYKLAIDNLERGNVTGDLVEFIHRQECTRIKPTPSSKPLPPCPKTPITAVALPLNQPARAPTHTPAKPPSAPAPTPPVIIISSDDDTRPENPPKTRRQPPRLASAATKNYLEIPPSPPNASPAPVTPASHSYANAARGEFQVVINKKKLKSRSAISTTETSPREREIIVTRHHAEPAITPSFIQRITESIRKRLPRTKCQGTISAIRTSAKGNLILTSDPHHLANNIWPYKSHIIDALNDTGIGSFDIDQNKPRLPFFINGILLSYPDGANHPSWTPEDWDDAAFTKIKSDFALSNGVTPVDRPFIIGGLARLNAQKSIKAAIVINTIRDENSLSLLQKGYAAISGRQLRCYEWVPDLYKSYCTRCLNPGHHSMMCKNRPICKHCFLPHHSDRHRCLHETCSTRGHCDLHDTRKCYNCSATSHFAGHDQCPARANPRTTDPTDDRTKLNDPTTSGKHQTRPHPSRFGPPLAAPSNPPPEDPNYEELSLLHRALRDAQRLGEPTPNQDDILAEIRKNAKPTPNENPSSPHPSDRPAARGDSPDFIALAQKRRETICTPYTSGSKPAPDASLFATEWTPEENQLFENLMNQDAHPKVPPRERTPYEALRDPTHDNPRCACPIAIQDRPCGYFEVFINLDNQPPPTEVQPDAELTTILEETAAVMSRDYGLRIDITSRGRMLVDGQDPSNTKGVIECAALYIRKNAKSRLAASGAQGARDVTVQTWRARAPQRFLGGDFRRLGALLASGDTENSMVPSWTFALALVTSDGTLRSPGTSCVLSGRFLLRSRFASFSWLYDLFLERFVIWGEHSVTFFSSDASLFGESVRSHFLGSEFAFTSPGWFIQYCVREVDRINTISLLNRYRINTIFLLNRYILRYPR